MAEIIRMPRLSDTMEEGNIVSWLKKVGEEVKSGDILAEVETDKATMELESFFNGTLLYVGVESGPVPVDGIIAIIGKKGEDFQALLQAQSNGQPTAAPAEKTEQKDNAPSVPTPPSAPAPLSAPETIAADVSAPAVQSDSRVKASPLAKSVAADAGIDISRVQGSGDQGRIVKRDIENYISTKPTVTATEPAVQQAINADFTYGDVPVSQMRKVIARRLGESKFSAPHFYLTVEINMDNAVEGRRSVNEISPVKVSFNDLVIRASAAALRKHPAINASWFGDKITYHKDIHIGVAVAVEDGLLVPVIRNADMKPLSLINQEVKEMAGKARTKKLQPQEMQGNTFTISNLGMFDIEEFTAIINPPDACILAVGSIIKKPVVKNDEIVIGNMMKVTLSCDHRVVDGATGAQFLQTLKAMLENPMMILV
jgi:pyruvate dehydrogenase E2 component (dihydrolipoamide acetyltransferase)